MKHSILIDIDMMRQTTEMRANSMAKKSMEMMLKNITSSFIAQLS